MSTSIKTLGIIPYALAPADQFEVSIDVSSWLGTDTIDSVTYTAVDEDNVDATSDVINQTLSTYSDTVISTYIVGGTAGKNYLVKTAVTTANGDKKSFYIKWICNDSGT